jgi:hypothetical protein
MGVILDDLWEHEGYGARRLPDGTLTETSSAATASFDAYVASCGCGWHGGDHPPTEDGTSRPSSSGRPSTPALCWLAPCPRSFAPRSATSNRRCRH